jgi:biotin transport system substrate-specific component
MTSFIGLVPPKKKSIEFALDFLIIMGASMLIALLSQVSIPLPFTPIPVTLQSLAILLVGAFAGSRRGALAVMTYIAEGMMGLPVLAGGCSGCAAVFGPTGGYLLGFVLAAWLTGYLLEKKFKTPTFGLSMTVATLSSCLILTIGALFLSLFVGGMKNAVAYGVVPFVAGDLLKAFIFALMIPSSWKFARKLQ